MITHNMEQGTDEWFQVRLGKFTASAIDALFMAKTTAGYRDLVRKVAFERITGVKPDSYSSRLMQRGNEMEAFAIEQYELETFQKVNLVGFCEHDNGKKGCSPDGLVGKDGMMQVKAPKYSTIFDYYLKEKGLSDIKILGRGYFHQVQMEMLVAERKWSDFVVYHPGLPLIIHRVEASLVVQTTIEQKIFEAEEEVEVLIESVKNYENG